ncbi:hypothetical protein J6590_039814 [Homalodisca vitripennis]|nr:hypothetical protein J6590_039814 [Homalodisca vitripennis]
MCVRNQFVHAADNSPGVSFRCNAQIGHEMIPTRNLKLRKINSKRSISSIHTSVGPYYRVILRHSGPLLCLPVFLKVENRRHERKYSKPKQWRLPPL